MKILTNLLQHLVTLIDNESLDMAQRKLLLANQRVQTTGRTNHNIRERVFVRKRLDILLERSTTVEDGRLNIGEVFTESSVFVLDLVRQLTSMAHDKDRAFAGDRLQLMEGRQDENRRFSETRLGLAEDIDVQNSGRNADLLDCSDPETAC